MTAIVGIVQEGKVYMGGDSAVLYGTERVLLPDGKVSRKGEFLLGPAGDGRLCDIIRHGFTPPKIPKRMSLIEYMSTRFVGALHATLEVHGYSMSNEGRITYGDAGLMVGIRGHLFDVDPLYSVVDMPNYHAIGSGGDFAKGSLYQSENVPGYLPQTRIYMALQAAQRFCTGVAEPFTILEA